jgi:hypothetical protein
MLLCVALTTVLTPEAMRAASADLDEGISNYNHKQYAAAIAKLRSADQTNSLVRYYEALSYQGAGNFAAAEKQYRFVYENSKDDQLRYKSWQGLQALVASNRNRQVHVTSSGAPNIGSKPASGISANSSGAPDSFYVDSHGNPVSSDPNQWFKFQFRPGCPRHWSNQ